MAAAAARANSRVACFMCESPEGFFRLSERSPASGRSSHRCPSCGTLKPAERWPRKELHSEYALKAPFVWEIEHEDTAKRTPDKPHSSLLLHFGIFNTEVGS